MMSCPIMLAVRVCKLSLGACTVLKRWRFMARAQNKQVHKVACRQKVFTMQVELLRMPKQVVQAHCEACRVVWLYFTLTPVP